MLWDIQKSPFQMAENNQSTIHQKISPFIICGLIAMRPPPPFDPLLTVVEQPYFWSSHNFFIEEMEPQAVMVKGAGSKVQKCRKPKNGRKGPACMSQRRRGGGVNAHSMQCHIVHLSRFFALRNPQVSGQKFLPTILITK